MARINLLPEKQVSQTDAARISGNLRKVTIALSTLLIVFIIGSFSLFLLNSLSLRESESRQAQLIDSIRSRSETEQKLVLLSDRLDKAKTIFNYQNAGQQLDKLISLGIDLDPQLTIIQAELIKGGTDLGLTSTSPISISQILTRLGESGLYKTVLLNTLTFKPNLGYELDTSTHDK